MEKKNKIVLFFDYHLGFKLAKFLKYKKENVVGLYLTIKPKFLLVNYKKQNKKSFQITKV